MIHWPDLPRSLVLSLSAAVMVAVLVFVRAAEADDPARSRSATGDRLHLQAGFEIDPAAPAPAAPSAGAALIHFGAGDPSAARRRIEAAGGTVIAYVPDHAYLVRLGETSRIALEAAGETVVPFIAPYKLSPELATPRDGLDTLSVLLFPGSDLEAAAAEVASYGGRVLGRSSDPNLLVRIEVPGARVVALAESPDVQWIERSTPLRAMNDNAQWVLQTGIAQNRRLWDLGIRGEGQVIMTSDSGLETAHDAFRDPANPIASFGEFPSHRKVIAYQLGGDDPGITFGDHASASYHGTHTASTALGNDDVFGTSVSLDGMAKAAKLWFMDIAGDQSGLRVIPFEDLNRLFLPSYLGNAGGAARIASCSWGGDALGRYDLRAMMADQFMWSHPDYLICAANGNSSGLRTVISPASAKSVVSVGGVLNGTASHLMYTITSRGPAADGRRKPTIASPTQLSSAHGSSGYLVYDGTSTSTPGAAGTAAMLRQYCLEGWYPTGTRIAANGFTPSAALLKAMLVASGSNQVNGFQAPDDHIGFGRITADSVLFFSGDPLGLFLADATTGIEHGQSREWRLIATESIPLEVVLCWTDYPGHPAAARALVNDLDLIVTNGAVTYRGNRFVGGLSDATNPNPDNVNVEERVLIPSPAAGPWTVRIEGRFVPFGPQPFAIVATGALAANAGVLALDRTSYGGDDTVRIRLVDLDAGPLASVRIASSTEPGGETVALSGANGISTGSMRLTTATSATGDGVLQVSSGDVLTAIYQDASPIASRTASAQVSLAPPRIRSVHATPLGPTSVRIRWTTDRAATSRVHHGETPGLGLATPLDPRLVLDHEVVVGALEPSRTYFYDVESQDAQGNSIRDDRGGAHHRMTTRAPADLLLICSGPEFERMVLYERALAELGWSVDVWVGDAAERPLVGDSHSGMRAYRAVWWQAGPIHNPPLSDAARDSIARYLGGGGRIAIVGHDVARLGDPASLYYTAARRAWLESTLHTRFTANPAAWTSVRGVPGDPVSSGLGTLPYSEHLPGKSGDEVSFVAGNGFGWHSWVSGDPTPDACGISWMSAEPLGQIGAGLWGGTPSRFAGLYFEWTGIDADRSSSSNRTAVLRQTIGWLVGRERPAIAVTPPPSVVAADALDVAWSETLPDPHQAAMRTIEYSVDGGASWTTIASGVGPSPYRWDLTTVPNAIAARVRVTVADDGSPPLTGTGESAAFTIARPGGDPAGPVVIAGSIAVSPNPIETGGSATLSASLSDSSSGGSAIAAAEWSAGASPAAPGQGTAMTGVFGALEVVATTIIAAGTLPAGTATVWVRGRDTAGHWGDASAMTVLVNDRTTPALLAQFEAAWSERGIEIRWRLAEPGASADLALERAARREGPWDVVQGERRREGETIVLIDPVPIGESSAYYRLTGRAADGAPLVLGPIEVTGGAPVHAFLLERVHPNPSTGTTRIDFAAPEPARVRITIVDVQGREVARLVDGSIRSGRHQALWSGEDGRGRVMGGVYFVVFRTPAGTRVRRIAIL